MPMEITEVSGLPVQPCVVRGRKRERAYQEGARADTLGEVANVLADFIDLGDHVLAIHEDLLVLVGTESRVEDRTVLRDVDFLTRHHGVLHIRQSVSADKLLLDLGALGQLQQILLHLGSELLAAVIQSNAVELDGELGEALRVLK